MPQYPTCSHIKEDGAFCGVAALRNQKYCYYHLMERGRRLRRARALRDDTPYRVDIPSLDNPYAVRNAITEIVQALGSGQLDPRVAGKMLYGIQLARAENKRIAQLEAAATDAVPQVRAPLLGANLGSQVDEAGCPVQASGSELERGFSPQNAANSIHELPDFEKKLGLEPGADLDAETAFVLRKADADAELRQADPMPTPPPGVRPGSAAWRVYREECYQSLQLEVKSLRFQLREYFEQKRQQSKKEFEAMYKEAGISLPTAAAKKSPASTAAGETNSDATKTA